MAERKAVLVRTMDVVGDGCHLVLLVRNYVVLVLFILEGPYLRWLRTIETKKIA